MPSPPIWAACVQQMRARISEEHIIDWVTPLHPVLRGGTLKLLAPNRYVLDHVEKNLRDMIEEFLLSADSGIGMVQIEIGGHESPAALNNTHRPARRGAKRAFAGSLMNDNYTFDKHVEGDSNQMARAAALQVGARPGRTGDSNPLFLFGGVGLGKTHLMQAAGHMMLKRNPEARVFYTGTELFVNNMVESIKNNAMAKFKRHYRSLDALLIDDIKFLANKSQSQEEFFHTFNALIEGKRQIIITSDSMPKEIPNVEQRLISRFSGGLTVGIEPPELETRAAILEKKAHDRGIELPVDVAMFIAGMVRSNVRELEGALTIVLAAARFRKQTVNVNFARDALRDRLSMQERRTTIDSIQRAVAEYYKLRISDLRSKSRARNITRPRQLAMYFAKEHTRISLKQIGERFERDHTTVLHAHNKIIELLKTDERMREDHRNLQRIFDA
ncbi:MAG: chromosomal replication initiator protein DnaA [Gammaproteobacteria bacterium]